MYTEHNFKTKKQLREAVAAGKQVRCYQPGGIFPCPENGHITLEGPHYPAPHTWYAQAELKNGVIMKVR
jgi:hypothetical protein